jgi:ATP-dependent RNA helicase DDX27
VVATPGRMIDHLRNAPGIGFEAVEILVLDEADRLLEMGFTEEVQELVIGVPRLVRVLCASKTCPFNCQTML